MGQQYGCIKVFRPSFKKKTEEEEKPLLYRRRGYPPTPCVSKRVTSSTTLQSLYTELEQHVGDRLRMPCFRFSPRNFLFFLIPNFCVTLIPLLFRSTAYM